MIVADLLAGDRFRLPTGDTTATFVARTRHPLYLGLNLVIWRLSDGSWSHDALDPRQDVGEPIPATDPVRTQALRAALIGGRS